MDIAVANMQMDIVQLLQSHSPQVSLNKVLFLLLSVGRFHLRLCLIKGFTNRPYHLTMSHDIIARQYCCIMMSMFFEIA